ncbi:MAG: sulfatase-like hydrolase/transferase [Acidimicrobiaceae bacterium]|nr:sulfatase-like hydrolase/transferase [Acidimicrobiaceae bacterium]MDE0517805.1 sulfatase-like hydrolase/transferase [Acidimicrobiaceae bacterium]MXZ95142.1 sulfatase-like hydrolase/transferase [Acidimicrobiaceae bacterium]MYF43497.1 sulfatase-like hydrolase/transferase [Acidimicrobiaceae bacterium]MYJ35579.1 sulfatase-like hydrolase/transferase [Acidimicrobiaceae bacterium]
MTGPNVVLIITDQQTRATISAYGNQRTRTPHMDTLAAGGIAFEKSYCSSPLCSPGRASIVTGQMPHTAGVDVNDLPVRDGIANLGEIFSDAGYETVWAGKWNLPESFPTEPDAIPGFENVEWQRRPYPSVEQILAGDSSPVGEQELYRDLGTSMDADITDAAVRYLAGAPREPFLLAVSLYNPHDICFWIIDRDHDLLPRAPTDGPLDELPDLPDNFDAVADEPEFVRWMRKQEAVIPDFGWNELRWTDSWDERHWRRYLYAYDRLVDLVDVQIGRVLSAISDAGVQDSTLVALTSDHGEAVAAHRWATKQMLYEEPVTVPLVLRWPGEIPAQRFDRSHLASGVDIVPTLCDYAGVTAPDGLAGESLRPVIDDPTLAGRDFVVAELQPSALRMELKGRMLRTRRYKYMAFSAGADAEMLFDLESDPLETVNLAGSAGHESVLADHRALLAAWTRLTDDPFEVGSAVL